MLMKNDKKNMAQMIVNKAKGGMEESMPSEPVESDNSMAEESAAQDLIDAVSSKDPKKVVQALKDLLDVLEPSQETEISIETE